MIYTHQVEKKVPLTVLESKIDNKSFSFVSESDSSLDDCLSALQQLTDHVLKIKKEAEEKQDSPQEVIEG